jgi:uncharacterized protein YdeI (YjbR/CyaY-like superfamily)
MVKTENFAQVEVTSKEEFYQWLAQHYSQPKSVWLVTYKKIVAEKYLSTADVLDVLLCFGWIDGIRRKLDDTRTMQLISPRKVEHWAASYKARATRLIEEGTMHEAGLKAIETSKQHGLWDFMDEVDRLVVPEDLRESQAKYAGATEFFHDINPSSKRFVLRWIKLAKTPDTRAARVEKIAQLSAKGEKLKGS